MPKTKAPKPQPLPKSHAECILARLVGSYPALFSDAELKRDFPDQEVCEWLQNELIYTLRTDRRLYRILNRFAMFGPPPDYVGLPEKKR